MWAKKSGRRRRIRAADPIWGSNGRAEEEEEEEERKRRRRNKTIKKDEPIRLERGKEFERALQGPEWDENIAMRVHTVLEDFMEFHAFFETPEECAFWQNFFMENPEVNELDPIIVAHRVSVSKWVFKKSPIRKTIKCCLLIQNRPPRCFLGISMTSRWFAFRHIISQSSITYIASPRSRTTIFKDCPPRASCKQSRFQPQALSLYKSLANLEVTRLFR